MSEFKCDMVPSVSRKKSLQKFPYSISQGVSRCHSVVISMSTQSVFLALAASIDSRILCLSFCEFVYRMVEPLAWMIYRLYIYLFGISFKLYLVVFIVLCVNVCNRITSIFIHVYLNILYVFPALSFQPKHDSKVMIKVRRNISEILISLL